MRHNTENQSFARKATPAKVNILKWTPERTEAESALLKDKSPADIIKWALKNCATPVATTTFGPVSAPFLHLISQHAPNLPVAWIDSGFNTPQTYEVADKLTLDLGLNVRIYRPEMTTAEVLDRFGGELPGAEDSEKLGDLAQILKLDPFNQMVQDTQADGWLNGIQRDETEFRKSLNILIPDHRIALRVAPLFYKDRRWLNDYIDQHNLPAWHPYNDPTKPDESVECGLHLAAS